MALADTPRTQAAAIASRWLAQTLAGYGPAAARAFERQPDPFANPVGHALRTALPAAVQALLAGQSPQTVAACLDDVIRIRAVQEFSPSQAIGFVLQLKACCECLPEAERAAFCEQVDQAALAAFDLYAQHRQRVCEVRVNEARRLTGPYAGRRSAQSQPASGVAHSSVADGETSITARGDCP